MLIDSSALIDYLRSADTDAAARVRAIVDLSRAATTDVVIMEILAGARDDEHLGQLDSIVRSFEHLPVQAEDFEHAATLYRACRRVGKTIRSLDDCLIAAVAIRNDVPVLHSDSDFDVLARYTPLRVA
jgi:predicted nucleic acid-binding protein